VAEIRAAVADTHALLFHAAEDRRLGVRVSRHLDAADTGQAIVHVPFAVVWEVSLLVRSGRIVMPHPVRQFFGDLFSNAAYRPYPLTIEQIFVAGELGFNNDPFDALIVSAAQSLRLPLLTRDSAIHASGIVDVIW
jgi:PIN domain nuclease of toxin-antitoxin system